MPSSKQRKHDPELLAEVKHAATYGQVVTRVHSRERMQERGARAEDVKSAILSATTAVEDRKKRTIRLEGGTDIDGDPLIVVVAMDARGVRLVTIM